MSTGNPSFPNPQDGKNRAETEKKQPDSQVEKIREYNAVVRELNPLIIQIKELDAARELYLDAVGGTWSKPLPPGLVGEDWSHVSTGNLPNDIKTAVLHGLETTFEDLVNRNSEQKVEVRARELAAKAQKLLQEAGMDRKSI
ncbi:MAG: hypothetical protein KBD55_01240 [Candidatus Pacebacteria bacterium]|nr:hypothetical protein [Candidatus Paceibacterota bacterium]